MVTVPSLVCSISEIKIYLFGFIIHQKKLNESFTKDLFTFDNTLISLFNNDCTW